MNIPVPEQLYRISRHDGKPLTHQTFNADAYLGIDEAVLISVTTAPPAAETGAQIVCHYDANHSVVKVENIAETGPDVDPDGVSYKGLMAASAALLKVLPSPQECTRKATETGVETHDADGTPGYFVGGEMHIDMAKGILPPRRIPFDLTLALAGAALATRDGREATNFRRIPDASYPYTATVSGRAETFTGTGHIWANENPHKTDLFLRDPDPSAPPVPEGMCIAGVPIDSRPQRGGWAPGMYHHQMCSTCGNSFIGDKRATRCADCVYGGPVIQPKADVPFVPNQSSRDWTEDFSHENGNYGCLCAVCGQSFNGHKRRHICRECAHPPRDKAPAPDADGECEKAFESIFLNLKRDKTPSGMYSHPPTHYVWSGFEAGAKWARGKDAIPKLRACDRCLHEFPDSELHPDDIDGVRYCFPCQALWDREQKASSPAEGGTK